MNRLDFIEKDSLRRDLPPFRVGDQLRVHVQVREGDKTRVQVFEGLCLRRRGGSTGETFTVRKISNGVGVERIFPVQSPLVTKLEILSRGFVRRARLYYLRELTGKKARLHSKVRDVSHLISPGRRAQDRRQRCRLGRKIQEEARQEGQGRSGRCASPQKDFRQQLRRRQLKQQLKQQFQH